MFGISPCHSEPFAPCHSEHSEESHSTQDRLREESRDPFPLFRVTVKTYKPSLLDSEGKKT
ncbi:MAG: hypothetical protein GH152_04520 [Dehalococcoidia bacterium]|nr:hypothetical protein [Dehalococcoidia bacterium]